MTCQAELYGPISQPSILLMLYQIDTAETLQGQVGFKKPALNGVLVEEIS